MALPINIEDLLNKNKVESDRIEFKKGWNPTSIYHSVCAFANDIDNIGGGYIIVGVEEENGVAKRPVCGIPESSLDKIQRELHQYNQLFEPFYAPRLSVEDVDGKKKLVIWAASGNSRPYCIPSDVTARQKKPVLKKVPDSEFSKKCFNYPYQALEEAVVNALYHRNYQEREPVEITIEPERISILSYSGPDRSISMQAIREAKSLRSRRYRNRRLGEFLKELNLTEGRATGIPTIQKVLAANGSPQAAIETDEARLFFLIDIPCHPDMVAPIIIDNDKVATLQANDATSDANNATSDANNATSDANDATLDTNDATSETKVATSGVKGTTSDTNSATSQQRMKKEVLHNKIIEFCSDWRSVEEIAMNFHKSKSHIRNYVLPQMSDKLQMLYPKGNHPGQKYKVK
ncbi:MAG: putative DNA binding domain-containing protein [Bacteroidales bacterium]|nr:putative DNA binding domain-containing protein [Bacteroidales bacterium]